jgi:L-iditol 2-dehydrogenase
MPEESCFPLGERLTTDHGSISEPLAIGVYSVKKSGGVKNLNIGILGYGPIGMSVSLAAKAERAGNLYVSDMLTDRLNIAHKEGAAVAMKPDFFTETVMNETKLGLDVVFECCGMQEAVHQAVDILKPGGKLVIVGIPEFMLWSFDAEKVRRKEISIQFIRRQVDCVQPSLDMMNSGQIDVSGMVTHRFPFSRTKEAFDLVAGYYDGVMKAMVDF